ncbi:hypothetical protein AB9M62_43180 [Bacillales bacterium AN1005]
MKIDIAKTAIDGIQSGLYEIIADEVSRGVQQGLAGGISALYPQVLQQLTGEFIFVFLLVRM